MTSSPFLNSLLYLIGIGLIFWIIWWVVGYLGIPEPFNKVIRVVLVVAAAIVCIDFLLGMMGHPTYLHLR